MLYDNVLKGIQSCSVLGFELCHVSDTPLTLEGWSNQAHRPSRSRRCPVRAESSSIGQQLLREWTRPPDRAVVGRAALLRSEPLPETPPASNCQWSPASVMGPLLFAPFREDEFPFPLRASLHYQKGISRTGQPLPIHKGIGQANVEWIVPHLDALACFS